jgi:mono/diheme cytochrome c family protein
MCRPETVLWLARLCRSGNRLAAAGICAVALIMLAGRAAQAFPWSTDMFREQSVQPLSLTPRNTPPGVLSEHELRNMGRAKAAQALRNPLSPTVSHLNAGEHLFGTYCSPCHGQNGKGGGPVVAVLKVPPADLTAGMPAEVSDGYIFWTIRNGGITMPSYGDAMTPTEMWEVVLYLRSLQRRVSAQKP